MSAAPMFSPEWVQEGNNSSSSNSSSRKRGRTRSSSNSSNNGTSEVNPIEVDGSSKVIEPKRKSIKVEDPIISSDQAPPPPTTSTTSTKKTTAVTPTPDCPPPFPRVKSDPSITSSTYPHPTPPTSVPKSSTKTHHRSPICPTLPPLPLQGSTCILDHFGPLAQTVHDLLNSLGPTTLTGIETHLKEHLGKKENIDRDNILTEVARLGRGTTGQSKGQASRGYLVDMVTIKKCLRVLLQHGIVVAGNGGISKATGVAGNKVVRRRSVYYSVSTGRACRLGRYQRYAEHVARYMEGEEGEGDKVRIIKAVMVEGKGEAEEIVKLVEAGYKEEEEEEEEEEMRVVQVKKKRIARIARALSEMIKDKVVTAATKVTEDDEEEKVRANEWKGQGLSDEETNAIKGIVGKTMKSIKAERGEVYTVNCWLLDRRLRGVQVSKFVEERVKSWKGRGGGGGGRIEGTVWKAAAFFAAEKAEDKTYSFRFDEADIVSVIESNPGLQSAFETDTPIDTQITKALEDMRSLKNPAAVVKRGEEWEICYDSCESVMKERRVGNYVSSRWGEDCARIFRILRETDPTTGSLSLLSSERISTVAMLPEKVTREMLHKLYTAGLVEFHDYPLSRQHAYNQTVYLWGAATRKVMGAVEGALRNAMVNIRDRRRVYINSDKNEVFDRLRNKSRGGTNEGGKTEEEAREERNAKDNLNAMDKWQIGLEDDLLLFEQREEDAGGIRGQFGIEEFM
ncbi:hypothetical protein TrCOL_g3993 [Triparma columacea]|uniref:DNA-directed RNA polymerase III subunit RPC3 n=1 Tax=Triparma columacea TaxID=722753 RepID=A0A9W7LFQ6_9STRA|nr:hypothetical protein TrCOL_g3993 [Triparma columacea]